MARGYGAASIGGTRSLSASDHQGSPEDRAPAFSIDERDGRYRILDDAGRVLLECGDAHSAGHYAALLNQVFERGYKAGYRDGNDA